MLTGRDATILVRIASREEAWSFRGLARELEMDSAALHRAVGRLKLAGLLNEDRSAARSHVEEFLVHGLRYLVPCQLGPMGRGVPTAWGADPLRGLLSATDLPPVWPEPAGRVRGPLVEPLADVVPRLARADPSIGEWFALIDGIRLGRARDRALATDELSKRIWKARGQGP